MGMMKITATLVLVAMVVATAMAHMALSKSMPEADAVMAGSPEHIQVWFTQAPDPAISQVTLEDGSGEVELGDEQEDFVRPPWLGGEVTDDPRYFNSALSELPFCRWPDRP